MSSTPCCTRSGRGGICSAPRRSKLSRPGATASCGATASAVYRESSATRLPAWPSSTGSTAFWSGSSLRSARTGASSSSSRPAPPRNRVLPTSPTVIDAIGGLLHPLLGTLEQVGWVQRHLFPPLAGRLADELAPGADAVAEPLRVLEGLEWPDDLRFMRDRLVPGATHDGGVVPALAGAAGSRRG